jgi:hypothetical protein
MSKNMIRKSLAFGAGIALVSSGFAAAPANAAIENFVTLVADGDYEDAYAVIAGSTKTFSLTATQGATAIFNGSKELKFLVTDPEGVFEPANNSAGRTQMTLAGAADQGSLDHLTNTVTVTDATASGMTGLADGDLIVFSTAITTVTAGSPAVEVVVADASVPYVVTGRTGTTVSFVSTATAAEAATGNIAITALKADSTGTLRVLREARNDDKSFVVDTGLTDGTAGTIKLKAPDAVTRTVTVQAFVDFVENDKIDSLDYVSPAREVTFVALADLKGSIALTPPNIGETSLTATISTSPVLNGDQVADATLLAAVFNRQDSTQNPIVRVNSNTQDAVKGTWTATVDLGASPTLTGWVNATTTVAGISLTSPTRNDWGFIMPTNRAGADGADPSTPTEELQSVSVSTTGVATLTTLLDHNLRTGDKITVAVASGGSNQDIDNVPAAAESVAVAVIVTGSKSFTYKISDTTLPTTVQSDNDLATATAYTISNAQIDEVFPGDYSATLAFETATSSDLYQAQTGVSTFGTKALLADDTVFTTVGSATLQGAKVNNSTDTNTDARIKAGTLTSTVTATVVDEDGVSVGAGRSVAWSMDVGANTTIRVNGLAASVAKPVLTTDANGQVAFAVTDTTGANGKTVTITATPEGNNGAQTKFTLEWATAAMVLYDLATSNAAALATGTRTVAVGASYDLSLFVADQWYTPAADADFRVAVSGSGVTEGFVPLVGGKATVKVTDSKVSTSFVSNLRLQKLGTTGVFANTTTVVALTTATNDKSVVTLGADGTTLYASAAVVDLSDAVAKVALVERDTRAAFVAQPLYVNSNLISGKVTNSTTGGSVANSVVTVAGSANILFSNGAVDKRGTITVVADANGEFAVSLYSTSAQKDTVITVTANGVSKEVKVTFTGIGVGEGVSLVVTSPANVMPASTFQVKAKLADAFGNGVVASAGRVKVTYTGAGIVFGALPTSTDANGELMFSVLLGANDTGNVVVTVSYDQNGDSDYVDAKDLNTTSTTTIGAAVPDTKVNVGTFSGKLVVYALNAAGSEVSYKIAGKWVTQVVTSDLLQRYDRVVGATGKTIKVDIYVDGVLTLAKSVVTK